MRCDVMSYDVLLCTAAVGCGVMRCDTGVACAIHVIMFIVLWDVM